MGELFRNIRFKKPHTPAQGMGSGACPVSGSETFAKGLAPLQSIYNFDFRSKKLKKSRNSTSVTGFSLIELMVALTIFSIVMVISLGTLLTLLDANSKSQALSSSMTNISFALDSISRNLRTGFTFNCANGGSIPDSNPDRLHNPPYDDTGSCVSGGDAMVFTPGSTAGSGVSERMAYRLNGNQIEQWVDVDGEDDGWVPITSNTPPGAVTIEKLRFTLDGEKSVGPGGDEEQPRISIYIFGSVDAGLDEPTEFMIQSNVTQRILNY